MFSSIEALQQAFFTRQVSAVKIIEYYLSRIQQYNDDYRIYTQVMVERAQQQAHILDQKLAAGEALGPLAAIPFAVKNLFDIKGVVTLAGAKLTQSNPPAKQDAVLIQRLIAADGI